MAVVYALHAQVIYDYRDITQKLVEAETWDRDIVHYSEYL